MRNVFFVIFFLVLTINIIFGQEDESISPFPATKHMLERFKKLTPDKVKHLPIFLSRFTPQQLTSMSDAEVDDLFDRQFENFLKDSGAYYDKRLEEFTGSSGPRLFTEEIMMSLKLVGSAKISPDGKKIVFPITTTDIKENKKNKDLFLMNIDGSNKFNFTDNPAQDFDPCWSSDGKKIAYISTRDGAPQIFIYNLETEKTEKITDIPEGVSNLKWSPDGKYFSFTSEVKLRQTIQEKYPALDKTTAKIYDKIPVRHWDKWLDEKNSHLFIMPVNGGNLTDLNPGEHYDVPDRPFDDAEQIAWSPDGLEIAYSSKKVEDYAFSTNTDIFVYNLKEKTTKNITKGMMGYEKAPQFSPDGRWIAFTSQERAGFESDRIRLMLYDRQTKKITELSKTLDQWVGHFVWSPDSRFIYFSAEDGPTVQIYQIQVNDGKWKTITSGRHNLDGGLDITPDGKTIIVPLRNMIRPYELYSLDINSSKFSKITFENDIEYNTIMEASITERKIKAKDGKLIHTWIIYPPFFDPDRKYPMITYCQGGPQSTISQYFSLRWNLFLMASKGYVVVAPNRRGLPGFGQAWNDAISKDWGGLPMQDILAATDSLAKEPYIDKKGIAAVGASAGGYAVFWLAGNHNKRFSAFVSHNGAFNLVSKYGSTEELWFPNWEFGGPYWDNKYKSQYTKFSPHEYVKKWDTPILISIGENDYRIPYTQGLEAFTAAQSLGIPSRLIYWENENHWILKPQNQILWYKELFEFLDKYCKKF